MPTGILQVERIIVKDEVQEHQLSSIVTLERASMATSREYNSWIQCVLIYYVEIIQASSARS